MLWVSQRALVIADLHLGKATHFRKNGIPVPSNVELENYERLSTLLLEHCPLEVLILGDLFHSDYNSQWPAFIEFLNKFNTIQFHLIIGNHDILDKSDYINDNLVVHENALIKDDFILTHHPEDHKAFYNLCGHIHPGVKLKGHGKQYMNLPCFYFAENQGILPAFGVFTGLHLLDVKMKDDIFGIVESEVIKLT